MIAEPTQRTLLKLQRMEMALVRGWLAHPEALSQRHYQHLRYLLGFARLTRFVPGGAAQVAGRKEVEVDAAIVAPLRELLLRALYRPLHLIGVGVLGQLRVSLQVGDRLVTGFLGVVKGAGQRLQRGVDDFPGILTRVEQAMVLRVGHVFRP